MVMAKDPRFKRLEFEPGTIIIEEGKEGEAAYLITKGTVDIRTGMRSDNPQTLATLGAGDVFGELAMFDGVPHIAAAVAVEKTVVSSMSRKEFGARVKKMDPVLRGVVMQMVGRTRRMAENLNKSKERPDWYD
jgi:CRP-like cAMP-binding protein|tara:strand:+ start:43 stop:441 length:399 start_codon:yes stop_codon:yes gene_type:complete